jgi:hypothetical protein
VKAIYKTFYFASSSSDKLHETLLYSDGTTSCGCPGWCRKVGPGGERTCRHTRLIDAGLAEREAVRYSTDTGVVPQFKTNNGDRGVERQRKQPDPKPSPLIERARRRFGFAKEGV